MSRYGFCRDCGAAIHQERQAAVTRLELVPEVEDELVVWKGLQLRGSSDKAGVFTELAKDRVIATSHKTLHRYGWDDEYPPNPIVPKSYYDNPFVLGTALNIQ